MNPWWTSPIVVALVTMVSSWGLWKANDWRAQQARKKESSERISDIEAKVRADAQASVNTAQNQLIATYKKLAEETLTEVERLRPTVADFHAKMMRTLDEKAAILREKETTEIELERTRHELSELGQLYTSLLNACDAIGYELRGGRLVKKAGA